jgi:LL-H family phage holin
MNIDITQICVALISLATALITTFLIPYIKSKTNSEEISKYLSFVKIAVQAAEQIYTGSGRGAEKKEYVVNYLESQGIKLDTETLNNMIESAVNELKVELNK